MKKRLVQLAVMLLMLFTLLTGPQGRVTLMAADDDPMPCDPPPPYMCELKGGTFNYVTCRCEFPPQ